MKTPRGEMTSIDKVLKHWLKLNKASARVDDEAIFQRWKDIVGEEIAACTRVVEVGGGELVVEVSSAPLLNELSTYYRQEILESIRKIEEFRGIHKLRFHTGSF